jgi:hypothetical protein
MPVRQAAHLTWQVLRTVKRSKKAPTGRALRLVPSRKTKDGSFLNAIVDEGLLVRVTGTAAAPFEATYALTERGKYAAEYGEYQYELKREVSSPAAPRSRAPKSR